jgi:type IV fimbrial biogenesis protein FimT
MTSKGSHSVRNGFTLVELLIAIVIVAVLAALAFPAFSQLILKHHAQDAANDIFTTLFKVRSTALRRIDTVTLRPNTPGDWTSGWKIMDSSSNVLDSHSSTSYPNVSITFAGASPIVYKPTGRVSSNVPTFTVTASHDTFTCTYTVSVDSTGRPYETTSGAMGTKTAGGGAPTC